MGVRRAAAAACGQPQASGGTSQKATGGDRRMAHGRTRLLHAWHRPPDAPKAPGIAAGAARAARWRPARGPLQRRTRVPCAAMERVQRRAGGPAGPGRGVLRPPPAPGPQHAGRALQTKQVLQTFTNFYKLLQTFTRFYKFVQIFTNFYKPLQAFTNFDKFLQFFLQIFTNSSKIFPEPKNGPISDRYQSFPPFLQKCKKPKQNDRYQLISDRYQTDINRYQGFCVFSVFYTFYTFLLIFSKFLYFFMLFILSPPWHC